MKVIYDDERGTKEYRNIAEMVYENLKTRHLDYNELSQLYVKYLQQEEDNHKRQLSEIDMPLIETYKRSKHLSIENTKDFIVRYLVKYNRFAKAPIHKELLEYVRDNNINLDGVCYNDLYKKDLLEKGVDE